MLAGLLSGLRGPLWNERPVPFNVFTLVKLINRYRGLLNPFQAKQLQMDGDDFRRSAARLIQERGDRLLLRSPHPSLIVRRIGSHGAGRTCSCMLRSCVLLCQQVSRAARFVVKALVHQVPGNLISSTGAAARPFGVLCTCGLWCPQVFSFRLWPQNC